MKFGSEVALNADVQGDRILVLEVVLRDRLGSRRCESRRPGELLVEVEVEDFRRERQVRDRSPAGDKAHHRDVEVGVAAEVRTEAGGNEGRADEEFCRVVIVDLGVAAEQAARPVGIPVVVVGTTDTPGRCTGCC